MGGVVVLSAWKLHLGDWNEETDLEFSVNCKNSTFYETAWKIIDHQQTFVHASYFKTVITIYFSLIPKQIEESFIYRHGCNSKNVGVSKPLLRGETLVTRAKINPKKISVL